MRTLQKIDFRAIAAATGATRGTVCYSDVWGWHVREDGDALRVAPIPAEALPKVEPGERLAIAAGWWVAKAANAGGAR